MIEAVAEEDVKDSEQEDSIGEGGEWIEVEVVVHGARVSNRQGGDGGP